MIANETNTSSFSKKAKSPYVLQYLIFEQRMKDPSKQKKFSNLRSRNIKSQCKAEQNPNNDTLQMVKDILKNKNTLWVQDKQNLMMTEGNQQMMTIKTRLQRIKSRSIYSQKDTLQQSRELNKITQSQEEIKTINHVNSRVISQKLLNRLPKAKLDTLNFLNYKKSKKSILSKFKRI